jgi:hypothetical protein
VWLSAQTWLKTVSAAGKKLIADACSLIAYGK